MPLRSRRYYNKATHLIVDPGPEPAAHVAAAACILENKPAKLGMHTAGIRSRRCVSLVLHVTILGRILRRTESRRANTGGAGMCLGLFQLAAQLLDKLLQSP
jgi:hypothetical protein